MKVRVVFTLDVDEPRYAGLFGLEAGEIRSDVQAYAERLCRLRLYEATEGTVK